MVDAAPGVKFKGVRRCLSSFCPNDELQAVHRLHPCEGEPSPPYVLPSIFPFLTNLLRFVAEN